MLSSEYAIDENMIMDAIIGSGKKNGSFLMGRGLFSQAKASLRKRERLYMIVNQGFLFHKVLFMLI